MPVPSSRLVRTRPLIDQLPLPSALVEPVTWCVPSLTVRLIVALASDVPVIDAELTLPALIGWV